jgi:hypothetical protein
LNIKFAQTGSRVKRRQITGYRVAFFLRIITGISAMLVLSVKSQNADTPSSVAAALVMKLAAFEQNLSNGGNLVIYVLGAPEVAGELEKGIGKSIGSSVLKSVVSGAGLPAVKPSILYVGSSGAAKNAVAYARANKVLSMSGLPDLASKGVTLSFGIDNDGKPAIKLNLTSTIEENVVWNPAIMKVVATVK